MVILIFIILNGLKAVFVLKYLFQMRNNSQNRCKEHHCDHIFDHQLNIRLKGL